MDFNKKKDDLNKDYNQLKTVPEDSEIKNDYNKDRKNFSFNSTDKLQTKEKNLKNISQLSNKGTSDSKNIIDEDNYTLNDYLNSNRRDDEKTSPLKDLVAKLREQSNIRTSDTNNDNIQKNTDETLSKINEFTLNDQNNKIKND
jgi:hypothetical protein